jgi:hypothetical protein
MITAQCTVGLETALIKYYGRRIKRLYFLFFSMSPHTKKHAILLCCHNTDYLIFEQQLMMRSPPGPQKTNKNTHYT